MAIISIPLALRCAATSPFARQRRIGDRVRAAGVDLRLKPRRRLSPFGRGLPVTRRWWGKVGEPHRIAVCQLGDLERVSERILAVKNDHLKHLELLRDHLRNERRKLARKMATAQNMPRSFTKLLELQQEFDAVKRVRNPRKVRSKTHANEGTTAKGL